MARAGNRSKALESASRHFDGNDNLTVNTLEAVYGQENSFGILMGKRGSVRAAGHFQFKPKTTRQYGLTVSKKNDQRFDIERASSAAARYLKDLNTWFGERTKLSEGLYAFPVKSIVETVPVSEAEFAQKSPADKSKKSNSARKGKYLCTVGHWRTIDDRPVFICA